MGTNKFVSIDWGTTNLRIRLVDRSNINIIEELDQGYGIKELHDLWKKSNQDKETFYLDYLIGKFNQFKNEIDTSTPLVLSGMCSSSIGIRALPYMSVPFKLNGSDLYKETFRRKGYEIIMISGVKTKNDVMRGEEIELIGLSSYIEVKSNSVCIFPGTHSKHVFCKDGKVEDFKTFMTGELFEVISKHTILKESVTFSNPSKIKTMAFIEGVEASLKETAIFNALFNIRTRSLLQEKSSEENYYYLSGLLIGEELKTLLTADIDGIILCAGGSVANLYQKALDTLNLLTKTTIVDKSDMHVSVIKGQLKMLDI